MTNSFQPGENDAGRILRPNLSVQLQRAVSFDSVIGFTRTAYQMEEKDEIFNTAETVC